MQTPQQRRLADVLWRQQRTQKQIDALKHVLDRANFLMEQTLTRLDEIKRESASPNEVKEQDLIKPA